MVLCDLRTRKGFCITMKYMTRKNKKEKGAEELQGNTSHLLAEPLRGMNEHAKIIWLFLMDNQPIAVTTRRLGELLSMNALTVSRCMVALEQHNLLIRTPVNGKRAKSYSYKATLPQGAAPLFEAKP